MSRKETDAWGRPYSDRTKGKRKGFCGMVAFPAAAVGVTLVVKAVRAVR